MSFLFGAWIGFLLGFCVAATLAAGSRADNGMEEK